MYDLPYHKENNPKAVKAFIEAHPFAFLTGSDEHGRPVATQIPLLFEERDGRQLLRGHFMKNTDHHKAFLQNRNALAVFTGHHTYVSGTWYSDPHTASTWNYMSVHVRGAIRFLGGNELETVLRQTSLHFENGDPESETVFDNLPLAFRRKVMHAIVAFEIEVDQIDTVFKLSQDRDYESYRNIIRKLKDQDEAGRAIAAEMERRTAQLFPDVE
ncbi:FMN-binding negative transcriptional regulator [Wenzhouxiangella sp. XN201]|uniref:FMN-binding negative transcriptional regulator n=1 Tax=Wenzhouxiangella sp. XN201 TaxID=2710755 RepID=UPI0013CB3413|nr:FMN-binding negative transcriptional regulator [Wenzhouxiangella sp. XN201]NEZ04959.1 FMN-binding negative transcriptional regulator [Wenzhouxiangella sp. XN201]